MDKERPLVEGEDFYYEGVAIVFTARYHLKRGSCCESGCRHCPYRAANNKTETVNSQNVGVALEQGGEANS